jgi:hypothetical protein
MKVAISPRHVIIQYTYHHKISRTVLIEKSKLRSITINPTNKNSKLHYLLSFNVCTTYQHSRQSKHQRDQPTKSRLGFFFKKRKKWYVPQQCCYQNSRINQCFKIRVSKETWYIDRLFFLPNSATQWNHLDVPSI